MWHTSMFIAGMTWNIISRVCMFKIATLLHDTYSVKSVQRSLLKCSTLKFGFYPTVLIGLKVLKSLSPHFQFSGSETESITKYQISSLCLSNQMK